MTGRAIVAFANSDPALGLAPGVSRVVDAWRRYATPGHVHVATFLRTTGPADVWVELQVGQSFLTAEAYSGEFVHDVVAIAATAAFLVPFTHRPRSDPWHPHPLLNCVSVAKAAIGLRTWRVWTPWQLRAMLERMPGVHRIV